MVGRELGHDVHRSFATPTITLEAKHLSSATKIHDISLQLHQGEVLGIAGLVGAGRSELLRVLAGVDRVTSGTIAVSGRERTFRNPREAIAAGIGLCPEERKREGIIPLKSIVSNVCLPSFSKYTSAGMIQRKKIDDLALSHLRHVNVRPFLPDRAIRDFSGGNQQKAIVARWLAANSQILLFDEPTRGIDVGTKSDIHRLIEALAEAGHSIIVVSSELPEIIGLSDRVLVMRNGSIAAELPREALTEQAIATAAISGSASASTSTSES